MSFSMGSLMVRSPFNPRSSSARLCFMEDRSMFIRSDSCSRGLGNVLLVADDNV